MNYKCLGQQEFSTGDYKLVPIRFEDRYEVMKWRNDQIGILRQKKKLTEIEQDNYFKNVVSNLFHEQKPDQILFSFLEKDELIGYGGLVHIDWNSKNAEISFLLKTEKKHKDDYLKYFACFLRLIGDVSNELNFMKIYTYGFDIADYRFDPLYKNGFELEAFLHEHVVVNNTKVGVRVYSKLFPI